MSRPEDIPEFIWRISKYDDLGGRGGLRVSGRWHTRPKCIVYCAADAHTAYLEVLRQYDDEMLFPDSLKLLKIKVPKGAKAIVIERGTLDPRWSDDLSGYDICQAIGDPWLKAVQAPLLIVPSVTGPARRNVLLNPAHRDADEFEVVDVISRPFPDFVRSDG